MPSDRQVKTATGATIDVLGSSGAIRVTTPDGLGSFRLSFDKLEELAADGTTVVQRADNFAGRDFNWLLPETTTFQGIPVTQIRCVVPVAVHASSSGATGTSLPAAEFSMTVYIFSASGNIVWADKTFAVLKGQVKYTCDVKQWPFKSTSNKLRIGVKTQAVGGKHGKKPVLMPERIAHGKKKTTAITQQVRGNSTGTKTKRTNTDTGTSTVTDVDVDDGTFHDSQVTLMGPAAFFMPPLAQVDSGTSNGVLATTTDVQITTYDETGVQWVFPYFYSHLVYDPTIDIVSSLALEENGPSPTAATASPSTTTVVFIVLGILLVLLLACALSYYFFVLKKRQQQQQSASVEAVTTEA
jgi:hypothetical protein